MLLIRCVWGNNLLIDTVWPSESNDFSSFCWPGTNTWTQDMQAGVSAKPADMEGREGWRRGRGEVKLRHHAWTAAVPQWAARGENHVPRSCSVQVNCIWEKKSCCCWDVTPNWNNVLICFFFYFCRHHRYWVSGVESADVIQHPSEHWSQFMSAFSGLFTWHWHKQTAANRRFQGT